MAECSLEYYCGIDELNLPYLAAGATGVLSVVGNVAADRNAHLMDAVSIGDLPLAREINSHLAPLTEAIMRTSQGAITAKVALQELGVIPYPTVRRPLVESLGGDVERVTEALRRLDEVPLATA